MAFSIIFYFMFEGKSVDYATPYKTGINMIKGALGDFNLGEEVF